MIFNMKKTNRMRDRWYGITYPKIMCHDWILGLWKKVMCSHGWHLLDECQSVSDHDIYCDACGHTVPIAEG